MRAREIIIIIIIISIIILLSFLISTLLIKKIKKMLLIIYVPILFIIILFFAFAYLPRRINRKYLKDNPIKIYCCYIDETVPDGTIVEIDISKKDELLKMAKKVYYTPYHYVIKDKTERASFLYYCIQYDNYYITLGKYCWKQNEGIYSKYVVIDYDHYYGFSNNQGIANKGMQNFNFEEWKKLFVE